MNDNTRLYSILAYIGPLFLVGLLADPNNPKVKFHVNQGLILFILEIAVWIVMSIVATVLSALLSWIPLIGGIIGIAVTILRFIPSLSVVLMILGIINAANDKEIPLPVIGGFTIIK